MKKSLIAGRETPEKGLFMNREEKSLYHQIHPLKLFTDWTTGIIALYPFWQHHLVMGLVIGLLPSAFVSFLLIRFASLEKQKESSFGKYVRKNMTRQMEAVRLVGYIIMAGGAWTHRVWLIPIGFMTVLFAWLKGRVFPGRST